jgi:putative transposase
MIRPHLQFLLMCFAGWVNRNQQDVIDYLRVENQVLREHSGDRRRLFTDSQRRRLARAAKRVGRGGLFGIGPVVTPDTLLRWHRRLVVKKYDGSAARGSGRPPTMWAIQELTVRMAVENPRWGYTRIRGALCNVGHDVGRNTLGDRLKSGQL